jgi:ABC-type transport system involved in multi-copper enzyme maturation permease subunit
MKTIFNAFLVECIKLRRTRVVWITIVLFIFMPLMLGLFSYLAGHPELMGESSLITLKAGILGQNTWKGYMNILMQSGASLGLVGTGFVTAYVFGREHTDRTFKDLLALPVSRTTMVYVKFILVTLWSLFLLSVLYIVGVLTAFLTGIPWDGTAFCAITGRFYLQAALTLLVTTPVAYIACVGKGFFAPLGFCILTLILANLVGPVGIGPYFPWAVPGLAGMNLHFPGMQVKLAGYLLLALTSAAGFFLTLFHWVLADHH